MSEIAGGPPSPSGPQIEVDAVEEAVLRFRRDQPCELLAQPHEPVERRALLRSVRCVGDVAVDVDQVDVGREVQLFAAQFAESEHAERRGHDMALRIAPLRRPELRGDACAGDAQRLVEQQFGEPREVRQRRAAFGERQRTVAHHDPREPAVLEAAQHAFGVAGLGAGGRERGGQLRCERIGVERRGEIVGGEFGEPGGFAQQPFREERGDAAERHQHVREAAHSGRVEGRERLVGGGEHGVGEAAGLLGVRRGRECGVESRNGSDQALRPCETIECDERAGIAGSCRFGVGAATGALGPEALRTRPSCDVAWSGSGASWHRAGVVWMPSSVWSDGVCAGR